MIFGLSFKTGFIVLILLTVLIYFCVLLYSVIRHHASINFLSPIVHEDGKISKSGLLFFILTLIISYQALFVSEVTPGLIEILAALALKDAGVEVASKWQHVQLQKIKTTRDVSLKPDDFKDL